MCALLVFLLLATSGRTQLLRGDSCITSKGENGFCEKAYLCKSALEEISHNRKPKTCSFDYKTPIVCCVPPAEPGFKANKMCSEYLMTARPKYHASKSKKISRHRSWIIGGYLTKKKVYPHMAAIGFGDEDSISWLCGGSLISELYVMTAAHCLSVSPWGKARWVLLGVTNLTTAKESSDAQLFSVAERIRHPDYRTYSSYHDIALLRLDRKARIDDYVKPACLHFGEIVTNSVVASGWGLTDWASDRGSSNLMSVRLLLVSGSKCNVTYKSLIGTRKLQFGIQDDKMVCAGSIYGGKDTCKGDSGGPLQYVFDNRRVLGVTSFGSTVCGARDSLAVYTRVSYYVPWIEDIVWPKVSLAAGQHRPRAGARIKG